MKRELEAAIQAACKDLLDVEVRVGLTRPDEQFGDYATNVALQLAKQVGKNPREVADQLAASDELMHRLADKVSAVSVAGPGFINLSLNEATILALANTKPATPYKGKNIVTEYSDPNPFKVLHAGHLYTSVVGDAVSNLLERAGGTVHRVNFGGDVGRHVGQTMWAILEEFGGEHPEKLDQVQEDERAEWMAKCYIAGTAAFETDEAAKAKILELNKRVYQLHVDNDHDSPLAHIYWTCRQWSYDYFDQFYARIGTKFEKYYPESEVADLGLNTVKTHVGDVFEESDGAIVFKGEKYGLHTRVFINQQGLPTYETKDVGLIVQKYEDYHFDKSVVITGNEQEQYMAVVLKAVEQFAPELVHATSHLTHGMVKLAGGVKMSSRKGNILRAVDVLDIAHQANKEATGREDEQAVLGAVKYAFLKNRTGGDIIYDPKDSVSLEGNSGPYLQYAHARARSILKKAEATSETIENLEADERSLLRKISEYTEVVDRATNELMPHHICTYLYELAQVFNRFYEHNRVIADARQTVRLQLVERYAAVLKSGLQLLGIAAPDTM